VLGLLIKRFVARIRLVQDFVAWLDQRGIEGGNLSTASAAWAIVAPW
jgi:hypothetical protein